MTTRLGRLLALALCLSGGACVEGSKGSGEGQGAKLSAYVLDSPPAVPHRLDINLENKVKLLGYRIDPGGPAAPGKELKLTLYWQVTERPGEGWWLFTHLLDAQGNRYGAGNIDNVGPLRDASSGKQALPPGDWQKGKTYVDEQTFRVPDDASGEVTVVTGIWREGARMRIVGPGGDAEQRAVVVKIPVGPQVDGPRAPAAPAQKPVPSLAVAKLTGAPPKIDGKLDDEAWKTASLTGPLVDVTTGEPNAGFAVSGSARVTWDDKNLYLGFEVQDKKLIGGFKPGQADPHLWEKECVEIMVDPDGDGDNKDYYEIQISPQNLVFDSQFDDYNLPRGGPAGPFGHQEWSMNAQTAVKVDGTLDSDDDEDRGYVVEAAIPWASFAKARRAPPAPGDTWRMNFYAMKNNGGVAWSPILREGNFHKASRFGRVTWVTPGAAPAASAAPSGSAPRPSARPGPAAPRRNPLDMQIKP